MNAPMVTVLMSCYNSAKFLPEAIESILKQTFIDFEFIIINDGSTDNTLSIINNYALKDPRIRVVVKKNTGLTDSLNLGINMARGQWIARLDADDVALPKRLQKQVNFLNKNPEVFLLGSCFEEIDEQGVLIKRQMYPTVHNKLLSNLQRLKRFFPHSSVIFATSIVKEQGGYNNRMLRSQDGDLWLRVAEHGEIACLNDYLVKIRKHAHQISHHENGRTQILYGLIARTCHFLRCFDHPDPSVVYDEASWNEFVEWISQSIHQNKIFLKHKIWACARAEYLKKENKINGFICFVWMITQSGYVLQIIKEKIFGQAFPEKLAKKWAAR